jgi:hypothetical protein
MASAEPASRRAAFLNLLGGTTDLCTVVDYSYDTEMQSWCQVTLRSTLIVPFSFFSDWLVLFTAHCIYFR